MLQFHNICLWKLLQIVVFSIFAVRLILISYDKARMAE